MKRIMRSMMKDGGLEISQNSRHHIDEIYHLVGVESNDAKQTVQTVYSVFMSEKAKKEKTAPKVEKAENTDSDQPEKVEKKTKAGFDLGAMMTRMSR
ncbi:hypothetical protein, partial [Klebsiella pneumoniae]|uniref:hypothetical protein n=1 Tax=Klebsiella pneumoniae TaxID=573 RepID=UPI003EE3B8EE